MPAAKKNEVVVTRMPPALPENPTTMDIIAMASRDPSVDVAKMRELLAMKREEDQLEAKLAFERAMTRLQDAVEVVVKDKVNKETHSKFASYQALDAMIRPLYLEHGFNITFDTEESTAQDMVVVVCDVTHKKGYTRRYRVPLPADGKGAKGGGVMTRVHAVGSALTYGKRYLLGLIFNIVIGDDDGNAAGKTVVDTAEIISADQVEALMARIVEVGAPIKDVCLKLGVERVQDCPVGLFDKMMSGLTAYGKLKEQKKKQPA